MNNLPIIMAAADTDYFIEHSLAFAKSCVKATHTCKFFIHYNSSDEKIQQEKLKEFLENKFLPSFSDQEKQFLLNLEIVNNQFNLPLNKSYYASLRFLILPSLLKELKQPILVLDIDSVINFAVGIPEEYDVGLYLREDNTVGANDYEIMGMKVAAGMLYVNATQPAFNFSVDIAKKIVENEITWFCDQHAIYQTYLQHKDKLKVIDFNRKGIMDWEFEEGSQIWTAKGNRKENPIYLGKKESYEQKTET